MSKIKYFCFGGNVISRDREIHKICVGKLPKLYGVKATECCLVNNKKDMHSLDGINLDVINPIILVPDPTGKYDIKKCRRWNEIGFKIFE